MGSDKGPQIIIEAADMVAAKNPNVSFLLYGDSDKINAIIQNCLNLKERYFLFHTNEAISADEKPSNAIRKGANSSMRLAIDSVKSKDSDAVVSAGNTGALMAISKIVLRCLPAIDRPAIVTSVPNQKKRCTVFLDMGANVECDSDVLYQFAIMGHAFAKVALNIANPSIGLLNVGSEDLKGKDSVRAAALLLKESEFADCFYGYVEGDDILKGTVDVVVTDGFCGNITLKAIEGTAKLFSGLIKEGFLASFVSKLGYLLAGPSITRVTKIVDPRMHNGAMLAGLNGVVVKSHGGTDKIGFANAINVAISLVENKINDKITEEIKNSNFNGQINEVV
jgi:glycerol-3-phosphate acyltransferase PlsX